MAKSKKNHAKGIHKLTQVLDESLSLLAEANINGQALQKQPFSVPSLLDQCVELCAQHQDQQTEPLRLLLHFGLPADAQVISSLATCANTEVIKDLHPDNPRFDDLFRQHTLSAKNDQFNLHADADFRQQQFISDLKHRQQQSQSIGQRMLLCTAPIISTSAVNSTDLLCLLSEQVSINALLMVCDPVVSYPAYCQQVDQKPSAEDFERYCQMLLEFIEAHPELTVLRYEDFVAEPDKVMGDISSALKLRTNEQFSVLHDVFTETQQHKTLEILADTIQGDMQYRTFCEQYGYELNCQHLHTKQTESTAQQTPASEYLFKHQTLAELQLLAEQEQEQRVSWARSVLQWHVNDRDSLTAIKPNDIYQHPDRERLALILANTYQQLDQLDKAREWGRLAIEWGCPKDIMLQLMMDHVQNTVTYAKTLADQPTVA